MQTISTFKPNTSTVSVLMSVYSEPLEWIKQAIDSILTQTFTDFEFIIINDKPDRAELVEFLRGEAEKDSRIKVHTNSENIGLTKSLNVGLKLCRGKYIARMDADDISMPTRFAKQVSFMDSHPEVIVCGTNISYFGDVPPMTFSDWIYPDDEHIKAQMLSNSGFAHPSVMIRASILKEAGITYDENYRQGQDYRMWEMLYDKGNFANIQEKLLQYRQSKKQISKIISHSQVEAGLNIRRRIRNKWLLENDIQFSDENHINSSEIKKLSFLIKSCPNLRPSGLVFLRTYYFSRKQKNIRFFFQSIILGHFFKFSFKNRIRYIAIILGKKQPIEW